MYFLVMISKRYNCPWNIANPLLYFQYVQDRVATEWTRADRKEQTGYSPLPGNLSPTFGKKSKICRELSLMITHIQGIFELSIQTISTCFELCNWVKDNDISATPRERSHTGKVEKNSIWPRLGFEPTTFGLLVRRSTKCTTRPSREQAVGWWCLYLHFAIDLAKKDIRIFSSCQI